MIRTPRQLTCFLLPILLLASGAGCTRTIYVPHGTPVRLRETVEDVKVWVKDDDGRVVSGRMDVPEGWFALPCRKTALTRTSCRASVYQCSAGVRHQVPGHTQGMCCRSLRCS